LDEADDNPEFNGDHSMNHVSFNPRYYHNGYVVRDMDAAIARLAGSGGPSSFLIMDVARGRPPEEAPIRRLALAGIGDHIYELIEADATAPSIYRESVPNDDRIIFHHTGFYIDTDEDWAELERQIDASGGSASAGRNPGLLRYNYVDRRADLGHFIEYVQVEEQGRALFASVPQNRLNAIGS
jgi:hypothetical protein